MNSELKSSLLKTVNTALERRIARIKENTKKQISEINKRVTAQRNKIIRNRLSALDNEMQIERSRTLGAVHKEIQEMILQAKHQLIRKIEIEVINRIESMTPEDQIKFERHLIEESLAYFGVDEGELRITIDPKFVQILKDILKEKDYKAAIIKEPMGLGVIMESPKRGFVIYNTLVDRLKRAREGFLESMEKILEVPI